MSDLAPEDDARQDDAREDDDAFDGEASLAEVVRQGLAADLHDDLVPYLFVSRQSIEAILRSIDGVTDRSRMDPVLVTELIESLRRIDQWLADAMNLSRELMQRSHLPDFRTTTWWQELQGLCHRLYPAETRLCFVGEPRDVSANTALTCYRVAGEAIRNAVRHSMAKKIVITTSRDRRQPLLIVHDDGRGFDDAKIGEDRFGLRGMKVQAKLGGLDLSVNTRLGGPTIIQLSPITNSGVGADIGLPKPDAAN